MGLSVKCLLLTNQVSQIMFSHTWVCTRAHIHSHTHLCKYISFTPLDWQFHYDLSLGVQREQISGFHTSSASNGNIEKHNIQNKLDSLSSSRVESVGKKTKNNLNWIACIFFLLKYFGMYDVCDSGDRDGDDIIILIKCMESGAPYM